MTSLLNKVLKLGDSRMIQIGDKVVWNDIDNDLCTKIVIVLELDYIIGVATVADNDIIFDVLISELSK